MANHLGLIAQDAPGGVRTFGVLFLVCLAPYLALQILALVKLRGGWRIAAFIPLAVVMIAAGIAIGNMRQGSPGEPGLGVTLAIATIILIPILVIGWRYRELQGPAKV